MRLQASELQLISTFRLHFAPAILDPFFLEKSFGNRSVPPPSFVCDSWYWLNSMILSVSNSVRRTALRLGGCVGADGSHWQRGTCLCLRSERPHPAPRVTRTQMCRFNSQSCPVVRASARASLAEPARYRAAPLSGDAHECQLVLSAPCFPPQPRLLRLASNAPVLHRRKHNPGESRSLRFDTGQCLSRWGWEPPTAAHAADDPAAGRRKLSSM